MRLGVPLALVLLLALRAPTAQATGGYTGDYLAAGPSFSLARFERHDALSSGLELSAGRVDSHIGFGGWLDYQRALGSHTQDRLGAGLQLMTGELGVLGVDLGVLAIRDGDSWDIAGRARAFVTAGWLGVAAGVGKASSLGDFSEVTVLLKVPFSCEMYGALPFRCRTSPH